MAILSIFSCAFKPLYFYFGEMPIEIFWIILKKTLYLTYGDCEAINLVDENQTLEIFSVTVCDMD